MCWSCMVPLELLRTDDANAAADASSITWVRGQKAKVRSSARCGVTFDHRARTLVALVKDLGRIAHNASQQDSHDECQVVHLRQMAGV